MKSLIVLIALTFSLVSFAKEESRVVAVVSGFLKTAEKIELVGIELGSSDSRYEIITTDKNGIVRSTDVSQFEAYLNRATSHLWNTDEVPVAEVIPNFVCYLASPDQTSTLYVERYSRKQQQGGLEKVLSRYGCQSPKRTQPTNSGDYAVAEGLLHFMKAAVNE